MLDKFVYCFVVERFGEDFLRFGGFGTSEHPSAIKYIKLDYILKVVDDLNPEIGRQLKNELQSENEGDQC